MSSTRCVIEEVSETPEPKLEIKQGTMFSSSKQQINEQTVQLKEVTTPEPVEKDMSAREATDQISKHLLDGNKEGATKFCKELLEKIKEQFVADDIVSAGVIEYTQKSLANVKTLLLDLKKEKEEYMRRVYNLMVAKSCRTNEQCLLSYLLGIAKDMNVDSNALLNIVGSFGTPDVVQNVVARMVSQNETDITAGMRGACEVGNNNNVLLFINLADDLSLTIKYEECLPYTFVNNNVGIAVMLLDRLKDDVFDMRTLSSDIKKLGRKPMAQYLVKYCKDKNIKVIAPEF